MSTRILIGDVREHLATLPDQSVQCCITSPPYYGLRKYLPEGHEDERYELGLESTIAEYIATMVQVFRDVRRVLRDDGTLWLNIGDSYASSGGRGEDRWEGYKQGTNHGALLTGTTKPPAGLKPKDLMMVPARLAIALQDDGWYLRSDIIWHKKAPMPESVTDRPTSAHEHIFLLTKKPKYFYDADAVREGGSGRIPGNVVPQKGAGVPGFEIRGGLYAAQQKPQDHRNQRNVWTLGPEPFSDWTSTSRQVPVSWDAADDDTMRTPSEDCLVHAWTGHADPIRVGDGRAIGLLTRTSGSGVRRGRGRSNGYAATAPPLLQNSLLESLDSLHQVSVPAASLRSNGTNRTVLVPETNPPCTASAQTLDCIGDKPTEHDLFGSDDHTPASSNATGYLDDLLLADTSRHNVRTDEQESPSLAPTRLDAEPRTGVSSTSEDCALGDSSLLERTVENTIDMSTCTCSYHKTVTESISHFAVFPSEVPRRCIKAGTSERGCCSACGAPWVRVTESHIEHTQKIHNGTKYGGVGQFGNMAANRHRDGHIPGHKISETTGWSPSCACNAAIVPCMVLDPFAGACTTGLVADQLGRDSIMIELNPSYAAMAKARIYNDAPLFADIA